MPCIITLISHPSDPVSPLIRQCLSGRINHEQSELQLKQARSPRQFKQLCEQYSFDLALIELKDLERFCSPEPLSKAAIKRHIHCPLLVLSDSNRLNHLQTALHLSSHGVLPMRTSVALAATAIQLALNGGIYAPRELMEQLAAEDTLASYVESHRQDLTPRQQEVAHHMANGLTNREIADCLNIAEGTAKLHVSAILKTLKVTNRAQLIASSKRHQSNPSYY